MALAAGEDRSSYQPVTPWHQDFGMCKATEGLTFQDPTFGANWANLKQAGIPRAAYHFFHPALSTSDQAKYFVSYVKQHGLEPEDGLAIDAEITVGASLSEIPHPLSSRAHVEPQAISVTGPDCQHSGLPSPVLGATQWCMHCQQYCGGSNADGQVKCTGCVTAAATAAIPVVEAEVIAFMDEVQALCGRRPYLIYTFTSMAESEFTSAITGKYPDLWIADFGVSSPKTGPWSTWRFWQIEGGGAPGGGDKDVYNGDKQALDSWFASFRTTPKPPPPPHSPVPPWQKAIIDRLPELREGASDQGGHVSWVRQLQFLLDIAAVHPVTVDGSFGSDTKQAVIAFQNSRHLRPDGVVGPNTLQSLVAGTPTGILPEHVARGTSDRPGGTFWVHRIQAYCNVHGVPTGIDGIFGPDTEASVKAVQAAYHVPATGYVDKVTWSLLIAHVKP